MLNADIDRLFEITSVLELVTKAYVLASWDGGISEEKAVAKIKTAAFIGRGG